MLDVIKSLGMEYCAANPGSTFRALHESIINYGANKMPELLTCCHEESSVGMAHGYAKIEGKPMMIMAHGNVGLQHASMSIFNCYADRVPLFIVVGNIPKGKAVLRSGARPGDFIYVSGTLGASVATLEQLRAGQKLRPRAHLRHYYPDPRIALGRYLREHNLASAMIDTSDGLSTDLRHICDESSVGALVDAAALPTTHRDHALQLALHGGEDYELLFTATPNKKVPTNIAGIPISRIGAITLGKQIQLQSSDAKLQPLPAAGWQHFA